ncbi:MAG: peptidoglycan editing factor PgeF [Rhizobiaceae bacterium]
MTWQPPSPTVRPREQAAAQLEGRRPGTERRLMLDVSRPEPVRSPLLERIAGIRHGFFTRQGGVSEGIYRGLNTGTGSLDDPDNVRENRARVARWMGVAPERLLTCYQIHSPDVIVATGPFPGERPKADALVTERPGLALGASAADCGPVLFADADARVIGAAHAGWKGAFTGVLENTIVAMESLGARRDRIIATLGPSISQANYEVGPEFVDRFISVDPENEAWFRPSARAGHAHFDLSGFTVDRLTRAGVTAEALGRCTYAEEDLFFSFRRSTHRGEPDYGRLVSAIMITDGDG